MLGKSESESTAGMAGRGVSLYSGVELSRVTNVAVATMVFDECVFEGMVMARRTGV